MKGIKQLFLFLIPTLLVALVCVSLNPLNQQNIFVADDSDSDAIAIKTEIPSKHFHFASLIFPTCLFGESYSAPVLASNGSAPVFDFSSSRENKLCNTKNLSPPINFGA